VRVQFSATGEDADEVLIDLVATLPPERPVVVVTDDRRLRREVSALGANTLSVRLLMAALGRRTRRD
jgi:rRNA-processing protein FCF1